jgi:hypothetical protein
VPLFYVAPHSVHEHRSASRVSQRKRFVGVERYMRNASTSQLTLRSRAAPMRRSCSALKSYVYFAPRVEFRNFVLGREIVVSSETRKPGFTAAGAPQFAQKAAKCAQTGA